MIEKITTLIGLWLNGWRHPYGHDSVLLVQQKRRARERDNSPYFYWLLDSMRSNKEGLPL